MSAWHSAFMNWRRVAKTIPAVVGVIDVVIRVGAVVTVPRNRKPTSATAWLMAIFIAPIPGSLLYAFFGSTRLPQDRRDKQHEINDLILEHTEGVDEGAVDNPRPPWFRSVTHLNKTLGAMPLIAGNRTTLLPDYKDSILAMAQAIDGARRYVQIEFYILTRDNSTRPFFDALKQAQDRGITVRVLFDHWATITNPLGRSTRRWLRDNDIRFEEMLPFHPTKGAWRRPDLRNHRKIVVVDGDTDFTGSQNMVDASYNKKGNIMRGLIWKDLMVRFDGPAAIGLNALFITDWYSETDEMPIVDSVEPLRSRRAWRH